MSNPRAKFEKGELIKAAKRDFEFLEKASLDTNLQRVHESGGLILGPGGIPASTLVKRIRDNLDQAKAGLEVLKDGQTAENINTALLAASAGNLDLIEGFAAANQGIKL